MTDFQILSFFMIFVVGISAYVLIILFGWKVEESNKNRELNRELAHKRLEYAQKKLDIPPKKNVEYLNEALRSAVKLSEQQTSYNYTEKSMKNPSALEKLEVYDTDSDTIVHYYVDKRYYRE